MQGKTCGEISPKILYLVLAVLIFLLRADVDLDSKSDDLYE